jgi:hypothetical protein
LRRRLCVVIRLAFLERKLLSFMVQFTQRVFSGVQPTGNLHLGNYLGALKLRQNLLLPWRTLGNWRRRSGFRWSVPQIAARP